MTGPKHYGVVSALLPAGSPDERTDIRGSLHPHIAALMRATDSAAYSASCSPFCQVEGRVPKPRLARVPSQ